MKDEDLEREVEKTFSMLDSARPAEPGPNFYSRLKARLDTPPGMEPATRGGITVVLAGLMILLLLNAFSLWHSWNLENNASREKQLSALVESYGLSVNEY